MAPEELVQANVVVGWSDEALVWLYRLTRPGILFLLVLLLVISGAQFAEGLHGGWDYWIAFTPPTFVVIFGLVPLSTAYVRLKSLGPSDRSFSYDFSTSEVVVRNPSAETHLSWEAFNGWTERSSAFLISRRPAQWFAVPKRAFASMEVESSFRQLLQEKLRRF